MPHYEDSLLEVHKVVVGPMDNNVYVIRSKATGDAVLIDAANEHELLLQMCRDLGVRKVLETHGHWDHIQAVPAVRDAGFEVSVTAADAEMLPSYDLLLEDDTVIEVGDLRLRTIATPGHTPGSMCFAVRGHPAAVQRRHALPGRPRGHQVPGGRLPHHHPVHRGPAVLPLRTRHRRAPRSRRRHHHRHRAAPSPGVGRPRLVTGGERG